MTRFARLRARIDMNQRAEANRTPASPELTERFERGLVETAIKVNSIRVLQVHRSHCDGCEHCGEDSEG